MNDRRSIYTSSDTRPDRQAVITGNEILDAVVRAWHLDVVAPVQTGHVNHRRVEKCSRRDGADLPALRRGTPDEREYSSASVVEAFGLGTIVAIVIGFLAWILPLMVALR